MRRPAFLALMAMLALLPRAAAAQSPPAAPEGPAFTIPPLENLEATRERPLFSPKRRPDAEGPAETPVVEESPENLPFELTGVVIGSDMSVAILRNRDTQETVRLRQGENLEAWSLQEVATRHVVLRQEDRQVRLELFQEKSDGSSPPPGFPAAMPPVMTRPPPAVTRPPPPPPAQTRADRADRPPVRVNPQQGTAVQRRMAPRRPVRQRRVPNP
jgi:type II secretory pathway component PulC